MNETGREPSDKLLAAAAHFRANARSEKLRQNKPILIRRLNGTLA
jgi:hypothetical protein